MSIDDITPDPEDLDFHGVTSRYADIEGVSIAAARIPERFCHLIDFAKTWAIGDDEERSNFMWLMPYGELKAFVDAVRPVMGEIEAWCAGHRDEVPVPDEVVLFDMMLEAAAEAIACHVEADE